MPRVIHVINISEGPDRERMLHLVDNEMKAYAERFGCIGRKTWKFLGARAASGIDRAHRGGAVAQPKVGRRFQPRGTPRGRAQVVGRDDGRRGGCEDRALRS